MSFGYQVLGFGAFPNRGEGSHIIEGSGSYNGTDGELTRTISSAGNRRTFILEVIFKRGSSQSSFLTAYSSGTDVFYFYLSGGQVYVQNYIGANQIELKSEAILRDFTAWYHLIVAIDTTQSTEANRVKAWVNGVELTWASSPQTFPTQNFETKWNTGSQEHQIGHSSTTYSSDYFARAASYDGQTMTDPATDGFGEYDDNGVWTVLDVSGKTFGTTGFLIEGGAAFTNGTDSSGNSQNFTKGGTITNVNDTLTDKAPDNFGNYATLNLLHQSAATLSNGALTIAGAGSTNPNASAMSTTPLFDYAYFEVEMAGRSAASPNDGDRSAVIFAATHTAIGDIDVNLTSNSNISGVDNGFIPYTAGSAGTDPSLSWEVGQYGVFAIRADGSGGTNIFVAEGGASNWIYGSGTTGNPVSNSNPTLNISGSAPHELFVGGACFASTDKLTFNFGQSSFQYTPPTGFKAVSTANLPAPTVTKPNDHYKTITYEGAVVDSSSRHTASGVTSNGTNVSSFNASQLIDNNSSTAGIRVDGTGGELSFDLGSAKAVGAVGIFMDNGGGNNQACTWSVLYSDNNSDFTDTSQDVTYSDGGESSSTEVIKTFSGSHGTHRYWKLRVESRNGSETATSGKIYGINLYSANAREITGVGFQPDFVWIKNRDATDNYMLFDSVRGATKDLHSNTADTEATTAESLKSFDTDGFTLGTDDQVNTSSESYVAWCWKAGSSNTAVSSSGSGSGATNACTHRANTTSGLSIIKYTGFNSTISAGQHTLVTHGLGTAPVFVMGKSLDSSQDWFCLPGENDPTGSGRWGLDNHMRLSTNDDSSGSLHVQPAFPTSTAVRIGHNDLVNKNGDEFIMYAWIRVAGMCAYGTYKGNGATDGTYVVVNDGSSGFRPAWVMIKNITSDGNWFVYDNKRNPFNVVNEYLIADGDAAVATSGPVQLDFTANGFKLRSTNDGTNGGSDTYMYLAMAENPFGGDGVAQAKAR